MVTHNVRAHARKTKPRVHERAHKRKWKYGHVINRKRGVPNREILATVRIADRLRSGPRDPICKTREVSVVGIERGHGYVLNGNREGARAKETASEERERGKIPVFSPALYLRVRPGLSGATGSYASPPETPLYLRPATHARSGPCLSINNDGRAAHRPLRPGAEGGARARAAVTSPAANPTRGGWSLPDVVGDAAGQSPIGPLLSRVD